MADQPKCGWWDQLTGNAIICSQTFQDYQTDSGQAEIQSVADNAADAYGSDSVVAQVAQSTADAQKKAFILDVGAIDAGVENSPVGKVFDGSCDGAAGVDLGFLGGPCLSYAKLKTVGIVAAVIVVIGVVLYAAGIVSAFLPKRG